MTIGTTALLSWLHTSTSTNQTKAKMTASGPNTTQMRNAPRRRYEVHGERTCYQCRQTGHYARECPRAYSQQLTETKVETMKNLIRSMTPNERSQFKRFVTRTEKLRTLITTMTTAERSEFKASVLRKNEQQEMPTNTLSRETSPHTNATITAAPPSRETGPHTNQMLSQALKRLAKIPERCEECGKEHPTCVCIDRFRRLKGLKQPSKQHPTTTIDTSDDESSGSDTLHESEDEDETTQPKSVTFDLPPKDNEQSDDDNDSDEAETQLPVSRNEEVDTQLVHAAWLRKMSDNVYK